MFAKYTFCIFSVLASLFILLMASWEAKVLDFDKDQVIHFLTRSQEIFAYHKITKLFAPRSFAVLAFTFSSMALLGCRWRAQEYSMMSLPSGQVWLQYLPAPLELWYLHSHSRMVVLIALTYKVMSWACITWYSVKDSKCFLDSFL